MHYDIDDFSTTSRDAAPSRNTGSVTALGHRVIWMTDVDVMGADDGMEAIVPMLDNWHFEEARRWNLSALSRYETKGEQDDTGITPPGDSWLVEWGLGHRLSNGIELGLVGYNACQLESDHGTPIT